jgi:hypothetical protein
VGPAAFGEKVSYVEIERLLGAEVDAERVHA